jgi:hypothetical protein
MLITIVAGGCGGRGSVEQNVGSPAEVESVPRLAATAKLKVYKGDLGVLVYPGDRVVIKNDDGCDIVVSTTTDELFGRKLSDRVAKEKTSGPYVVGKSRGKYLLQTDCVAAEMTMPTESPSGAIVEPNVVTRATFIIVEPSIY